MNTPKPVLYYITVQDTENEYRYKSSTFVSRLRADFNSDYFFTSPIEVSSIDRFDSKKWIYPLCMTMAGFRSNAKLNELMDQAVIDKLKSGFGALFFACMLEADTDKAYKFMHRVIEEESINPEQIVYVTGGETNNSIYGDWCKENDIPVSKQISFIVYQTWLLMVSREDGDCVNSIAEHINRPDKFLSFNHHISRIHRIVLLARLRREGQIRHGRVSALEPINVGQMQKNIPRLWPSTRSDLVRINTGLNLLKKELPLKIDGGEMTPSLSNETAKHYHETYYSLVTETNYTPPLFLTEKISKPIFYKHPFVVVAPSGYLKMLRSLGFKTFHPIIDETYDDIECGLLRMDYIIKEVKRLNNMSNAEWDRLNIKWFNDIVEHNKKVQSHLNAISYNLRISQLGRFYEYE